MAPPTNSTPLIPPPHTQRISTQPAFLYPLRGIYYFCTHRYLWPLLRSRLLPAILLSTLVLFNLFFWTYLPQVLFLAIFHGRNGALLNGAVLVLGEGAAITALLFEAFFVDGEMRDAFDAVLIVEAGESGEELVSSARPVTPAGQGNEGIAKSPLQRLGKVTGCDVYSPFNLRQIVEFVLLLPLNLVPWIGVPLFLWLTGYRAGPLQHWRYFELRDLGKEEKRGMIKRRRVGYTGFGCVALILQLVPVLSMVFLLTTATGSALWAAEIEMQEGRSRPVGLAPVDGPPPEYSEYIDDPV